MSIWRPHTTNIIGIGVVLILVALVASYAAANFQPTTQVRLGAGVFNVQTATTEPERVQGLSGVEKLASNDGLLMVFEKKGLHGIWMKDMLISIDIVWLDENKKVIYIVNDASPDLQDRIYKPNSPAKYVLEMTATSVRKSAVKIGDTATFSITEEQ